MTRSVGDSRARAVRILAFAALVGCRQGSPTEPGAPPVPRANPVVTDAQSPRFQPPIDVSLPRIARAWATAMAAEEDAGPLGPLTDARRLAVGAPDEVDVIAARAGARWVVAAVERDRVTLGLEGAERIHQLREAAQRPMSAMDLAVLVGAMHYYPFTVFDGQRWTETPSIAGCRGLSQGSIPTLAPRPQGGRDLTFAYHIPDGRAGAGGHLAHLRVTDSGMLIDQAPHPEVR